MIVSCRSFHAKPHPSSMQTRRSPAAATAGFSLVEIAVVITIIGIVLSALLPALVAQQVNSRLNATRAKEEAIKAALVGFIARNNRLPCPADGTLTAGSAYYGVEALAATNVTAKEYCTVLQDGATAANVSIIAQGSANVAARGIVPWVTLGLPDDGGLDGYGRRFSYVVQLDAVKLTSSTIASLASFDPARPGQLKVYASVAPPTPVQLNINVATVAVVISHGNDAYGAYLPDTGLTFGLPPAAAVDETANTTAGTTFVQRDFSTAGTNPFDDVVMWMSPGDLLGPLLNNGTVQPYQSSMQDKFNDIGNAFAFWAGQHAATRVFITPASLPAPVAPSPSPVTTFTLPTPGNYPASLTPPPSSIQLTANGVTNYKLANCPSATTLYPVWYASPSWGGNYYVSAGTSNLGPPAADTSCIVGTVPDGFVPDSERMDAWNNPILYVVSTTIAWDGTAYGNWGLGYPYTKAMDTPPTTSALPGAASTAFLLVSAGPDQKYFGNWSTTGFVDQDDVFRAVSVGSLQARLTGGALQ